MTLLRHLIWKLDAWCDRRLAKHLAVLDYEAEDGYLVPTVRFYALLGLLCFGLGFASIPLGIWWS